MVKKSFAFLQNSQTSPFWMHIKFH